jgi:hypothetical protein
MGKKKVQPNYRRRTLRLPDLDHSKLPVGGLSSSLGQMQDQRSRPFRSAHESRRSSANTSEGSED